MRILLMGTNWPLETFLQRLVDGLANRDCQIILATDQKPSDIWLDQKNCVWYWMPSWNVRSILRFVRYLRVAKRLASWPSYKLIQLVRYFRRQPTLQAKMMATYRLIPIGAVRASVVYFPWVLAAENYGNWYREQGIPVIISLRGSMVNINPHVPPRSDKVRRALNEIFDLVSAVHCVSDDILSEAMHYGLQAEKATVIRPAVDPGVFCPPVEKEPSAVFRIITTGSLIWRKGYEYALLTVRELIDHGVQAEFHIIGDGPERQRVLYTIRDLGLDGRVKLHGKLPPDEVRVRLQQSDVFLLSSLSEGISNAVLEAMSCGLPVVSTDCGGMREAITDGVEGFLTPPRDPAAAASALRRLALDPELRLRMGKAARERILKDFTLDQQVEAFIQLFQSVSQKQA